MPAIVLTPQQREAALSLMLDYVVASSNGLIVALMIDGVSAHRFCREWNKLLKTERYAVYHLSNLNEPIASQVAA